MLRAKSESTCWRSSTFIGRRDLVDDALGFVVSKCYSVEQNQTWSLLAKIGKTYRRNIHGRLQGGSCHYYELSLL